MDHETLKYALLIQECFELTLWIAKILNLMSTTQNLIIRILSCCVRNIQDSDQLVRINLSFLTVVLKLDQMEDPMVLKSLLLKLS